MSNFPLDHPKEATYVREIDTHRVGLLLDKGQYWAKVRFPMGTRHTPIHKLEATDPQRPRKRTATGVK